VVELGAVNCRQAGQFPGRWPAVPGMVLAVGRRRHGGFTPLSKGADSVNLPRFHVHQDV
jgi:hypothetical protein